MTRTDLATGKNVTLLMFIRSRVDMRELFDSDNDPVASGNVETSIEEGAD
jgi:hypothetical protein